MTAGTERSSRASTFSRLDDRRPALVIGWRFRELSNDWNHMVVSFADVVCERMTTALPARRPNAGAVPGRRRPCLAARPHRLLVLAASLFNAPKESPVSEED